VVAVAMIFVRGRNSEYRIQKSEYRWFTDFGWRVANAAALVVIAAAVVSPWAIRNDRIFGKPIVTTTHGGYTLLLGNNLSFYEWLENNTTGTPWTVTSMTYRTKPIRGKLRRIVLLDPSALLRGVEWGLDSELGVDSENYHNAYSTIRSYPSSFIRACIYRLGQLWSPLPHKLTANESMGRRLLRYATCGWYCGVYALAAVGIWRLRWRLLQPPWIWGVLLCLTFTAVHTFYWTNLRMRAPLMPFVALVAAAAAPRRLCFSITDESKGYAKA
jgi:hypothetical protein